MVNNSESFVIVGATVVDPANLRCEALNVFVTGGKIAEVSASQPARGLRTIVAAGAIVSPGLIDVHVHLRDPGLNYKEDISSGTAAAAAGGFTTVFAMPNTTPVCDNAAVVKYVREKATKSKMAKVIPVGAITRSLFGKSLAPYEEMQAEGITAISDDGACVLDEDVMYLAALKAKALGLCVITHPEDKRISADGVINEGKTSQRMNLKGVHRDAENSMIARDISISAKSGAHIHLAHVSTKEGVALIKTAKENGVNVTCEVTPHHLFLTDEVVETLGANAKMSPPLRESADCEALKLAIQDGTIDMIATDHAPHSPEEKDNLITAPFGVIGLESSLPMCLRLVDENVISISRLIELMSHAPARIFNLNAGALNVGAPADIVIFDKTTLHSIDSSKFKSKSRNCPFDKMTVKGLVLKTFLDGVEVYSNRS